ncbi:pyruvate, phosphate dikinase [Treponema endosymbiont of Eucomonympha sp.]|uniref:pyruvate, phosphate dikinase n=1 Tax=Treponema endosymbiont of Eucomonympha sp. TaxID=1580831 RepID=UPI0007821FC4|nr:pyruvate, phosphate dikinase [Treponema endosymbiont of Eucomonympha sp.]
MSKWVYAFGNGQAEGDAAMRNLLGGKGANLAEMNRVGLLVPPGFTVTTEVCTHYYENDKTYPADLLEQVRSGVSHIERLIGRKFGDAANPLLVSVRSGARVSMPGMMDTVLNLGLNDATVRGLAAAAKDERFAYDSYRRFIMMFSNVVLGADIDLFEHALEKMKERKGCRADTELAAEDLKALVAEFKRIGKDIGKEFPQDPWEQLNKGIGAVFGSWMTKKAITYRKINSIPGDWGTAVNVQAMVFGNAGDDCATGVCFSRDPATGENRFYGEYLCNAQGEDVVAGIRTPQPLAKDASGRLSMQEAMPEVYAELTAVRGKLEKHYKDMQDMEFTIEHKKLWMLQTRSGKRTAPAAIRVAVEMVAEGLLTKDEAIMRVDAGQLDQVLHPTLDPKAPKKVIATGLPASPGAAVGRAVFHADDAEAWKARGEKVILVRIETSPEDIGGMHAAEGVITARGGMTSHAAVVARGMGTPCVSGSADITINYAQKLLRTASGAVVREGDWLSIDGAKGQIIEGAVPTMSGAMTDNFGVFMKWVDEARRLEVRANAETPSDARHAREFGAEGIGLARTEHMFFDPSRIQDMRGMILAQDEAGRRAALAKLLPYQKQDFKDLFAIMDGLPVTIRLLDPPLHEFLPHTEAELRDLARHLGLSYETVAERSAALHEANPMLGHRGCRLAVTYPEICEMQTRAILEAALECQAEGKTVTPEIEVPLVGSKKELDIVKAIIDATAEKIFAEKGAKIGYKVGSMIELPRAALLADEIAESCDFFGFGTNDLTQTILGMSRDDTGKILDEYRARGIYAADPFASVDVEGVGKLIEAAVKLGRKTKGGRIHIGVCGEHGGDPESVYFFDRIGMDFVSCSPFRVPIARLAAAQAAVKAKAGK